MLMCALRDGAHGAQVKGIAGSVDRGADSIVVSGTYERMDIDDGETIHYSGSGSHQNTDQRMPQISTGTKVMQKANQLRKVIRVIRSSRGNWSGVPTVGFRYDGLYRITRESIEQNLKGGAYIRFTLKREPNQPPIDFGRPTRQETLDFDRVHDYY